jgi:hypothetical protein
MTKKTYRRRNSTVSTCRSHRPGDRTPRQRETAAAGTSGAELARARRRPGSGGSPLPHTVAKAEKLALNAPVPHRGFSPGQLLHNPADLGRDRQASRGGRISPLSPHQAPVPGQQHVRCHDPVRPQTPGQYPRHVGLVPNVLLRETRAASWRVPWKSAAKRRRPPVATRAPWCRARFSSGPGSTLRRSSLPGSRRHPVEERVVLVIQVLGLTEDLVGVQQPPLDSRQLASASSVYW